MLVGVCGALDRIPAVQAAGADYIEVSVQNFLVPEKPDADFEPLLEELMASGLPALAANGYLPSDLRSVGPGIDQARLMRYAETALTRAAKTGIKYIVFGSSGSRSVVEGYDRSRALDDFATSLSAMATIAEDTGVTLAIEPLRTEECNLINTVEQGAEMARRVNRPGVRLLADLYHMLVLDESPESIARNADMLVHVHIAEKQGRKAPGTAGEDFTAYLDALQMSGYAGAISIECGWSDFNAEVCGAVAYVREQLAAAS